MGIQNVACGPPVDDHRCRPNENEERLYKLYELWGSFGSDFSCRIRAKMCACDLQYICWCVTLVSLTLLGVWVFPAQMLAVFHISFRQCCAALKPFSMHSKNVISFLHRLTTADTPRHHLTESTGWAHGTFKLNQPLEHVQMWNSYLAATDV